MVLCSLRSLLVAGIVLSNCIAWTASRHHYTHNVSGHRSRHRRQGKGLYLSSSYVIPGGEGTGWGDWGDSTPCSRTCGGGVASQKRICLKFGSDGQPQCTGGDTKYFSCETQDCPSGSVDFRAEQCSQYDDVEYRNIKYKWKPYTRGPNPCELNCMPHGERFYYRHQLKVIDGTRCNDDSFDVCVNGTCQPVGCDMMLGSNAREDKCRRCRGNGKNCYTTNGVLDTQDLIKGYNDMLLIPEGATTIIIMEVKPSNNYLALRAKNGTYYLNGDYHIDFPRSMMIGGALWFYERSQQGFAAPDKLRCLGPTNEPLYLSLLLQSVNVGIEYEYSLPSERAPRPTQNYTWVHENFTPCSVTCGGGFQTRNVTCRTQMDLDLVDDALCDEGLKPVTNQTCNNEVCPPQWVKGEWGPCSHRCGPDGIQSREIQCEKIIVNGFRSIVSEKECFDLLGPKPEKFRECNVNTTCPIWFTGPWTPCDKLYGEGKQTRQVVCYQKNGRRIDVLDDSECTEKKPDTQKTCLIHPEERTDWVVSEWSGCDNCFSTLRSRIAKCTTYDRKLVEDSFCAHHPLPVLQEPCDTAKLPPCNAQWYATQWSKCSSECGDGTQTRRVFCGIFVNNSVVEVEESKCAGLTKYSEKRNCTVPKEECPSLWYTAPWSKCNKECGGGEQSRRVFCLRGDQLAFNCGGFDVPESVQLCNTGPCNKDEIIPLDSNSTPIIDEEEECDYEEDYAEVGLDFALPLGGLSKSTDLMFSDTPSADIDSGTETASIDTETDSEFFSVSDDLSTTVEGSGSDFFTNSTDFTYPDTTDDYSTDSPDTTVNEPSLSPSSISDLTSTRVTKNDTVVPKAEITTKDISTSKTESLGTDVTPTEGTELTVTDSSTGSDETTESDYEDETSVTTDASSFESSTSKTFETGSTDSSISPETAMSTDTSEFSTNDETSGSESTESTDITETTEKIDSSSEIAITVSTVESSVGSESITDIGTENTSALSSSELSTNEISTESTTPHTEDTEGTTPSDSTDSTLTTETEETSVSAKETSQSTVAAETTDSSPSEDDTSDKTTMTTLLEDTDKTSVSEGITTETIVTKETSDTSESEIVTSDKTTMTTLSEDTDKTSESEEITTETIVTKETSDTSESETVTSDKTTLTTLSGDTDKTSVSEEITTESLITEKTTETTLVDVSTSEKIMITTLSEDTRKTSVSEEATTETTVTKESSEAVSTDKTEITTLSEETGKPSVSEEATTETIVTKEVSETGSTEAVTTDKTGSTTSPEEAEKSSVSEEVTTEMTVTKEVTETSSSEGVTTDKTVITTLSEETEKTSVSEETTIKMTASEGTTEVSPTISTETKETSGSESTTELIKESSKVESTIIEGVSSLSTESEVSSVLTTEKTEGLISETTEVSSEGTTEKVLSTTGKGETILPTTVTEPSEESSSTFETLQETGSTTESSVYATESTTEISTEYTTSTTASEIVGTTSVTQEPIESSTSASSVSVDLGLRASTEGATTAESEVMVITTEKAKAGFTPRSPWATPTHKRRCKPRKRTCAKSTFGCCPDRKTAAKGPYDEGCPRPKTCHESKFGCCPDGLSPALGPFKEGCPTIPCAETLFGCCSSDNKTAAEGNDQEGCPPPPPACKSSEFGCCADGETEASGPEREGCPELSTSTELPSTTESETKFVPESTTSTEEASFKTEVFSTTSGTGDENCTTSTFGCCYDQETPATGPKGEGCPCNTTEFGCCPDGISTAKGDDFEGCVITCNSSRHGCCPDGKTPAHGPDGLGCCLLSAYGCCPDNYKPAEGPHLEGCGCQYSRFGCCPDNATAARGPNNQDCGCQYTEHGCCPDRHTEAAGPDYEGCGCHTYQFGCCPDGVTVAKGPSHQGCDCRDSQYGCCGDGKTPATGPEREGCDCATSEYGCCPDGLTEAKGHKFYGCSDVPENKQAACGLDHDRGSCRNYSVYWYYDLEYGGCSRFWYGGCEGNGNKFATKEECEDVCVQPAPKDACNLPKVKGACLGYNVRWYYDSEQEHCSQFIYGGCLGNANNFASQELCVGQCQPERSEDQCQLPIDRGSCAGNFGRWGFNSETRRCEQFIWGGCEGNTNRFSSEIACIQRCDPPGKLKPNCMERQDVGDCVEKQPAWFFSQTEDRCVPFYYSGCGGNGNRFDTERSCANACPSAYVPDMCTLPAAVGDCADYRERWYYDTREKSCQRFYYGGCGGNGNNFATQMECEGRCSEVKTPTTTVQPVDTRTTEMCFMEKNPGPCTDTETRWMYDYKLGKCLTFEYGGCGGNQNNFPTEEYCQYYCGNAQDICQLPMMSGPCSESLMRWFYDPSSDSCSQFTYGGCDGNGNRFDTRDDCENRCRTGSAQTTTTSTPSTTVVVESRIGEKLPSECYISPSEEPCQGSGQVWYLDQRLGECVSHDNLDSGNSCRHKGVFLTQEACERTCGAFRNINVCRYDLDPGPCRSYVPKYYFDKGSKSCREFAYGGCHGGPNRFSTIDECQEVCKSEMDPCKQDVDPGDCTSRYVMWYYDNARDTCLQFIYGGCHGNENRFETLENCEKKCRKVPESVLTTTAFIATTTTTLAPTAAPTPAPTVGEPIAEECRTPESLESCGANITVYYYDQESRSCIQSDIGGCRYANSFRTEEECERRCGVFRDINVCEARLDPGPCRAAIPKFYWEPASGSCLQYTYGGCGGGANRFSTIEECEEICGNTGPAAACKQPVSTGTSACGMPSRRWYYSVLEADCLAFAYQGCNGTDNSFVSYEECADLCKVSRFPDVVGPDCGSYEEECLQLVCPYGMSRGRTPEGCTRCACVEEPVNCEPMRAECEQLRCTYGQMKSRDEHGCVRCSCLPDPCLRQRCPFGESCVAIARMDPVTNEAQFSAVCKPVNEVLPDCDRFNDECSRLHCEYGVQRTRTVDGCERCTCVQVEIDCAPLKLECERLKCNYLVERHVGPDGCERCRCSDHPCKNKECGPGDRCVPTPYVDPITQESRFSSECRSINKTGYCPVEQTTSTESTCYVECHDDADCRGVGKCCARGCSRVCAVPDAPTSPPPYTTTHAPDLPQSPQVSHETEPEVAAEEGGKATLRCIFHGNPPPKITWRRGEITIDGDRDRYRLLSDGSLEIVSVYRNDSGVYICVAENDLGTARQEIYLKVKDPVKTSAGIAGEQRQEVIGVLGKRLVVRCLTYGYPPPTVSWHRGLYGSMVPYSSSLYEARDNVLLIRRLTYETVGEYACQAYNGIGLPASWLVVVKAHQTDDAPIDNPYILPRIREPDEAIHVEVKEVTPRHVVAYTTTTSTTPEPEIDSRPIFNVPVHTKISASSSSLTAGSELVLECEVDGYPEPDLYWAKDGRRIIPNDNIRITGSSVSHLTVARLSLTDGGTYECHAQNDYSSHYSYLLITVQPLSIPAKCTDSPFFANCPLIVRSKFCQHKYYSKFCCKSCLEAGQLSAHDVEMQADQPLVRK